MTTENLVGGFRKAVAEMIRKESAALDHYIKGLGDGIPYATIILAMQIHKTMLEEQAKGLERE